ncbi:MAG: CDP-alcohol phosphatidyltransferase family protein [Rhodospirillales bacterium]|nr:CDP-alcohol phosphatidyltransferase family protein [Rhodospirillales bacterium]
MLGTRITPNHLTTGRLVTGIAACAAFMPGDPDWDLWGGVLWLVSCLLDRADGELARLSGASSEWGHRYDYYCDVVVNSLFFLAIGIGLRNSDLGGWAVVLGALSGMSVAVASVWSEQFENLSDGNDKAYAGILGFDFDDVLYLFGPAAWFGLFPYILVGASVCAPIMAVLTWVRLVRLRGRRAS